jgi:WD40 repeat protein
MVSGGASNVGKADSCAFEITREYAFPFVILPNIPTDKVIRRSVNLIGLPGPITAGALSPSGNRVVLGFRSSHYAFVDLAKPDQKPASDLLLMRSPITAVTFSDNEKRVAMGYQNGRVAVLDFDGTDIHGMEQPPWRDTFSYANGPVRGLVFSSPALELASAFGPNRGAARMTAWSTVGDTLLRLPSGASGFTSVAINDNSSRILFGHQTQLSGGNSPNPFWMRGVLVVRRGNHWDRPALWVAESRYYGDRIRDNGAGFPGHVSCASFVPNSSQILIGVTGNERAYEPEGGLYLTQPQERPSRLLGQHELGIHAIRWNLEGDYFATVGYDHKIKIWNAGAFTARTLRTDPLEGQVIDLQFLPTAGALRFRTLTSLGIVNTYTVSRSAKPGDFDLSPWSNLLTSGGSLN